MVDKGTGFGLDLYELWQAGRDRLPTVALQYTEANNAVAHTDDGLAAAFLRSPHLSGDSYGPVYPAWKTLRDELQTILHDTAKNLELVGEALCLAANEYAKADSAAEKEFNRLKRDNGDPVPPQIPPLIKP
jgi:hypothetical protein